MILLELDAHKARALATVLAHVCEQSHAVFPHPLDRPTILYASVIRGTLAAQLGDVQARVTSLPEVWEVRVNERAIERATATHEAILAAGGMVGILQGARDGAGGIDGEMVGRLYASEDQVMVAMRSLAAKGVNARFARARGA